MTSYIQVIFATFECQLTNCYNSGMNKRLIYEGYHANRAVQNRILKADDFTYKTILGLIRRYKIKKKMILDIGCGVGSVDFYLAEEGNRVVGIDISKNAINSAIKTAKVLKKMSNPKFIVGDIEKLNFKNKFDVVICSEVLEHLDDDENAVISIRDALKYHGILIASSPSTNAPLYKLGLLKNFDQEVGHVRRYSPESLRQLIQNNGFKIIYIKKTEGILRNFLFTNRIGGFLLKLLKRRPFSILVSFVDDLCVYLFGESDIYIVARKK